MSNIDRCPGCGSYRYGHARHGYGYNRECLWPCNHEVLGGEAACGLCGPDEDLARRAVSESESEPLRELAVALHPDSRIEAMANVRSGANVHTSVNIAESSNIHGLQKSADSAVNGNPVVTGTDTEGQCDA